MGNRTAGERGKEGASASPNRPTGVDEEESSRQRAVLDRLRQWYTWNQARHCSPWEYVWEYVASKVGILRRPSCPSTREIESLCFHYFPPLARRYITVLDHGPTKSEVHKYPFQKLPDSWSTKPDWAVFRWIHLDVGPGVLSGELGSLFFKDKGDEVDHGQSYEVYTLKSRQYLQEQIDVFNILQNVPASDSPLYWTPHMLRWESSTLLRDRVQEMSEFFEKDLNFWDYASSDISSQLPDPSYETTYWSHSKRPLPPAAEQLFSRHSMYANSTLVRSTFKILESREGIIFTMSPTLGISEASPDFQRMPHFALGLASEEPGEWLLGTTIDRLTDGSYLFKSAHEFRTYLETEMAKSPTAMAMFGAITVQDAYRSVVQSLKARASLPLKRHESVDLVRDYSTCINEVTDLQEISERNVQWLNTLRDQELERFQSESPDEQAGFDVQGQIQWAKDIVTSNNAQFPRLIADLRNSLNIFFQLRTMEQNELALIAESNNKAILVFTIVTIVFLPLSFFTSYFGMNVKGVVDTEHTERYFWAVCATSTACIATLTILFGFWNRLYAWAWTDRDFVSGRSTHEQKIVAPAKEKMSV